MTDTEAQRRSARIAIALFALILLLFGRDVIADSRAGMNQIHLGLEAAGFVMALTGIALLWRRFVTLRSSTEGLRRDLRTAREEAERWRQESQDLLRGFGEAIDRQFGRWKLTPAEAEIGLLLLKGLSHKEVAVVRRTSERTVRDQARSVYGKAGLGGRAELAAFFLEDLLLPTEPARPGR